MSDPNLRIPPDVVGARRALREALASRGLGGSSDCCSKMCVLAYVCAGDAQLFIRVLASFEAYEDAEIERAWETR